VANAVELDVVDKSNVLKSAYHITSFTGSSTVSTTHYAEALAHISFYDRLYAFIGDIVGSVTVSICFEAS